MLYVNYNSKTGYKKKRFPREKTVKTYLNVYNLKFNAEMAMVNHGCIVIVNVMRRGLPGLLVGDSPSASSASPAQCPLALTALLILCFPLFLFNSSPPIHTLTSSLVYFFLILFIIDVAHLCAISFFSFQSLYHSFVSCCLISHLVFTFLYIPHFVPYRCICPSPPPVPPWFPLSPAPLTRPLFLCCRLAASD